jgi:hypothetical protein
VVGPVVFGGKDAAPAGATIKKSGVTFGVPLKPRPAPLNIYMTATASNLPSGRKVYLDQNGAALANGIVTYWVPGTTTLLPIWLDDQQSTPSPNPVTLDAAGSCTAFGVGEFREYVTDKLGNIISDSVVVASTPLFISAAMLPVLEATSIAAAEALLAGTGGVNSATHLSLNPGDQTLSVVPTANSPATLATLNVQGATVSTNEREFLVNLGLTTGTGVGGTAGNDKVTLYSGLQANPGTADIWTLNTCLTMSAGSGSYNAQGFELDFNNFNADRGASGGIIADFTAPIANGLSVTGLGNFTNTTGIAVESQSTSSHPQWARGVTTLGTFKLESYHDWASAPVCFQMDGVYSVAAINLTSTYGNNGATTPTALFIKNGQFLAWQNAAANNAITDYVDVNNNRVVGIGASGIILGAAIVPITQGLGIGGATARWGDAYINNLRLPNNLVVSWNNVSGTGLIFDYVDTGNNRIIGSGSNSVYIGAGSSLSPIIAGASVNLGSPSNYWTNVYSSVGIVAPSDIKLKTNVQPVVDATTLIEQIAPITFNWKEPGMDNLLHYGFNAAEVHDAFPADFAGYREEEGRKMLVKDELVGVLWAALRELTQRVTILEGGPA